MQVKLGLVINVCIYYVTVRSANQNVHLQTLHPHVIKSHFIHISNS